MGQKILKSPVQKTREMKMNQFPGIFWGDIFNFLKVKFFMELEDIQKFVKLIYLLVLDFTIIFFLAWTF